MRNIDNEEKQDRFTRLDNRERQINEKEIHKLANFPIGKRGDNIK